MEQMEGNGGFGFIGGESAEIERLEAAYATITRRDGTAERRAWHWQMTALLAIVGLIGLGVWDHVDKRAYPTAICADGGAAGGWAPGQCGCPPGSAGL